MVVDGAIIVGFVTAVVSTIVLVTVVFDTEIVVVVVMAVAVVSLFNCGLNVARVPEDITCSGMASCEMEFTGVLSVDDILMTGECTGENMGFIIWSRDIPS